MRSREANTFLVFCCIILISAFVPKLYLVYADSNYEKLDIKISYTEELLPDVEKKISVDSLSQSTKKTPKPSKNDLPFSSSKTVKTQTKRKYVVRDINKIDSTELAAIPFIAAKRAKRILNFRQSLGGYVTEQQYHEVYHMDSLSLYYLKQRTFISDSYEPNKIPINTATYGQMMKHPYFRPVVKEILEIRKKQFIQDQSDFKTIKDTAQVEKILPYVSFGK